MTSVRFDGRDITNIVDKIAITCHCDRDKAMGAIFGCIEEMQCQGFDNDIIIDLLTTGHKHSTPYGIVRECLLFHYMGNSGFYCEDDNGNVIVEHKNGKDITDKTFYIYHDIVATVEVVLY